VKKKVRTMRKIGDGAGILFPSEWLSRQCLKPGARVRLEITEPRISVFPDKNDAESLGRRPLRQRRRVIRPTEQGDPRSPGEIELVHLPVGRQRRKKFSDVFTDGASGAI